MRAYAAPLSLVFRVGYYWRRLLLLFFSYLSFLSSFFLVFFSFISSVRGLSYFVGWNIDPTVSQVYKYNYTR